MAAQKPRQIAVRILKRHSEHGQGPSSHRQAALQFIEDVLEEELANETVSPPDRRLIQELTFGIVRWQAALDWLIGQKTNRRTQKPVLQILLRLGLYQIFWLDRIPDHAAVNETVEMAREMGFGPQSGFVNALLRGYLREREQTQHKLEDLKKEDPAIGYSHPAWLCARWEKQWGTDALRQLLQWNNTPPPTFARVNTLKTTVEKLAAIWEKEEVRFVPVATRRSATLPLPKGEGWGDGEGRVRTMSRDQLDEQFTGGKPRFDWIPYELVFKLESHPPLSKLASFQEGLFYVQDPSTLLAVTALDPKPGEAILDLCAAPGGKTTFMAQLMENRGLITAQDPHMMRRQMVKQNCERLGVTCVRLSSPAEGINPELSTPYDRVLVDAPCSNTGVMRRRVDLRWRVNSGEIMRLASAQRELLKNAAQQVKSGGVLVYSTCSLEPEENEQVVEKFVGAKKGFVLEQERTLLPFRDGVDGAYVAKLRRSPPM